MEKQTDTDDLPATYQLKANRTEFILPCQYAPKTIHAIAYNPFRYIPLTQINRVIYASSPLGSHLPTLHHVNAISKSSFETYQLGFVHGIPNPKMFTPMLDDEPVYISIQRQNTPTVSKGTMTVSPNSDNSFCRQVKSQERLTTSHKRKVKSHERSTESNKKSWSWAAYFDCNK